MPEIRRIAFLSPRKDLPQDAISRLLEELREKGYQDIGFFVQWTEQEGDSAGFTREQTKRIGRHAENRDMRIIALIGYMKYCAKLLAQHPEWRMRRVNELHLKRDELPLGWACPFNPEYKELHKRGLREIAKIGGIREISLNDEATLGFVEYDWACYCEYCQATFRDRYSEALPTKADWSSPIWKSWITWRFETWLELHKEFREVIREVNPGIAVSFQVSPASDLWMANPWVSAFDTVELARILDSLSVDPYHVYHKHDFNPEQTYITEVTRFFKGALFDKPCTIITQGMTAPSFQREMNRKDGYWESILPLAVGASACGAFTYEQLCSKKGVREAYEESFKLDKYFEHTSPLRYAAVVHGFQTEVWKYNEPAIGTKNYDYHYFRRMCAWLRYAGIPYDHVWDKMLNKDLLSRYRTALMPNIACLDQAQRKALLDYVRQGGGLIATSDFATCNEQGESREDSFAEDIVGVKVKGTKRKGPFTLKIMDDNPLGLSKDFALTIPAAFECEAAGYGKAIGMLLDRDGKDTGLPGLVVKESGERAVYLAGEPVESFRSQERKLCQRKELIELFNAMVSWTAKGMPEIRIEDFPPMTEYRKINGWGLRDVPSLEYFPCVGDRYWIAILASYRGEEMEFDLAVDIPEGRRIKKVYDGLTEKNCPLNISEDRKKLLVKVKIEEEDAVLPLIIEWEQRIP